MKQHEVDHVKVHWLAWAHDLNRWPFAHNAEKGRFDQSADVWRYFRQENIPLQPTAAQELQGIISKTPALLSEEGRIVLLADIIAGFVEDPLWSITALDLHPSFVPSDIAAHLCMVPDHAPMRRRLLELNELFASTRSVEPFESAFDSLFQTIMQAYVSKWRLSERLPLADPEFEFWRRRIKDDFMRAKLFAYNNDRISKGPLLRAMVIDPLYATLGDSASSLLTTIDEPNVVNHCIELKLLRQHDTDSLLPDLDYVRRCEPANSFRLSELH